MIRAMIRVAVLVVATLLVARPAPADAQIYRWVDERGVPHFTQGIDSVPRKYRARAAPFDFRNSPRASSTAAGPDAAGSTEIKFMKGDAILVDATINGRTSVKLILDTGADRTVITPRALTEAGVSLTEGPTGQIRGATGTASVQTAALDSLEIGDAKVSDLLVIAHDIEQGGVDGLLGRDFLDHFKLSIDSDNGIATLAPKNR
jgi:predicted aspartyl protease